MTYTGAYDSVLVALSVLIATVASYTALDLAGRIRASSGWARHAWLATAAAAMGGGIWAMHFVAMLAFQMPDVTVDYAIGPTAFSFALPVLATGTGFFVMSRAGSRLQALALSSLLMGFGIVGMHYLGMAAMRMPADLSYGSIWVAISVLIAIGASAVALWLAFRHVGPLPRLLAAVVMGLAIAGMHYASMQGAVFTPLSPVDEAHGHASLNQTSLALAVSGTTLFILFLALVAAMFDRRFADLAQREALALRQSEERFRTLYHRTPLPLHSLSADGVVESVSDAWLELMGYRRDEVEGRPLTGFMVGASREKHAQSLWPELLKTGEVKGVDCQLVTKDGRTLDVLISGRIVQNTEGAFSHVLGGIVDVTARKRAEEALRQAQKIEAIGALTGGIAHDFNNLLAVVLGNLDLLRSRLPDDPKIRRLLDTAIQGAERGATLTQRMLAFARRQDLKTEIVDVRDLVNGMADLLQRSIGPMVQIETRFPLMLSPVRVDANQLELALLNLAVNARDAMPGGGHLTIAAHEETIHSGHRCGIAEGPYVCLSVTDTGEGMDETTRVRAMEPFFTTKGVGKGTGLGLSMVHGLAAQSGGCLMLQSSPHEGTTAEIWLPVATVRQQPQPAGRDDTEHDHGAVFQRATVLVVDDDPLVLHNTAAMLEDLGHTAIEAASGEEALDYLWKGGVVDLVLTDQAMPRMTGLQMAERIKAHWPGLPVILATGYANPSDDSRLSLPRLSKPFRREALKATLAESLKSLTPSDKVIPFRPRPG